MTTICCDQGMDFDGEDTNDFSVDRRDRTSEAGISGSSSDDEDDERGVNYFSEAIERMGEPSTSGRDYQRLSSTEVDREMNNFNVINTVEVKQEVVEAKLFDNNVGDFQKVCSPKNEVGCLINDLGCSQISRAGWWWG